VRFTDQVVVVTGAGYGIGRGIAEAFAREGAHVVLSGRSTDKLAQVEEALSSGPAKPLVRQTHSSSAPVTKPPSTMGILAFSRPSIGLDLWMEQAFGS